MMYNTDRRHVIVHALLSYRAKQRHVQQIDSIHAHDLYWKYQLLPPQSAASQNSDSVTHLGTSLARCRATLLICQTTVPLCHATQCVMVCSCWLGWSCLRARYCCILSSAFTVVNANTSIMRTFNMRSHDTSTGDEVSVIMHFGCILIRPV